MRVCCVSDLHGRLPNIPECDVLVIVGDIAPDPEWVFVHPKETLRLMQWKWFQTTYAAWEATVPAKHILVIPGNHDWWSSLPESVRARALVDEGCTIDGKTFYGTPWVPIIEGRWNYEANPHGRLAAFESIPPHLDLLITHAPPYKVLDFTHDRQHAGCRILRAVVQEREPRFQVFGHIHEGCAKGREATLGSTTCYNVSMWGPDWTPRMIEL